MPLWKVTNSRREKRFLIQGNSLEDIKTKGKEKFLYTELPRVVLEDDGTFIDDDDVFGFLPNQTVLLLLMENEKWEPKSNNGTEIEVASTQIKEPTPSAMKTNQRTLEVNKDGIVALGGFAQDKEQTVDEIELINKAKIFNKNPTEYHQAINTAAAALAKEEPVLVTNRGKLLEKAREKVREEGYVFKKGYSRSSGGSESGSITSETTDSKKRNMFKNERKRQIGNLQEELESFEKHIRIKQMRIDKAATVKDFKLCDSVYEEKRKLMKEKAECERQLSVLQKKEAKAKWYKGRRSSTSSSSSSSSKNNSKTSCKKRDAQELISFFKRNVKEVNNKGKETKEEETKEEESKDDCMLDDDSSYLSEPGTPETLILSSDNEGQDYKKRQNLETCPSLQALEQEGNN